MQCLDCFPMSTEGACVNCLILCHANHKIGPIMKGPFYCDCGFKKTCCKISKPLTTCFLSNIQSSTSVQSQFKPFVSQQSSISNNQQTSNPFQQPSNPFQQPSSLFQRTSDPFQQPSSLFQQISNPSQQSGNLLQQSSNPSQQTSSVFQQTSNPLQQSSNLSQQNGSVFRQLNNLSQQNSNEKDIAELKEKIELLWKATDMCTKCYKHKPVIQNVFTNTPVKICPGCGFKTT